MVTLFGIGYDAAERMGVLEAMRDRQVDPFEFRYVKPDGRHKFSVPSAAVHALLGPRALVLLRGDVEEALYKAVHDTVDIRFSTTVESVSEDPGGVHVVLSDGSSVDAELLVGADGLHSTVRRLVFGPEHEFRRDLNHMVTALVLDRLPDRVPAGTATMLATVGRTVTVISLGQDRAAAFLIHATPDPAADLAAEPVRTARENFGDLGWLVPDIQTQLHDSTSVYFDTVSQIVTDRWSRGRVVLLGDAAWCVSLFGGYGVSLALGGADLLATTLDHHPHDIPAALATWESQLSGVAPGDAYASGVLPGMLVTSLGCGLCLPALTGAAVAGITEENAGLGAAIFSSVQQIGGAVGLAVLVTLASGHSASESDPSHAATKGFTFGLTIAAALLILGAVLITALLRSDRRRTTATGSEPLRCQR